MGWEVRIYLNYVGFFNVVMFEKDVGKETRREIRGGRREKVV